MPSLAPIQLLRTPIKKALAATAGAPEVVLWLLSPFPLDPVYRWFLSLARMWRALSMMHDARELLSVDFTRHAGSRLGALQKILLQSGVLS